MSLVLSILKPRSFLSSPFHRSNSHSIFPLLYVSCIHTTATAPRTTKLSVNSRPLSVSTQQAISLNTPTFASTYPSYKMSGYDSALSIFSYVTFPSAEISKIDTKIEIVAADTSPHLPAANLAYIDKTRGIDIIRSQSQH